MNRSIETGGRNITVPLRQNTLGSKSMRRRDLTLPERQSLNSRPWIVSSRTQLAARAVLIQFAPPEYRYSNDPYELLKAQIVEEWGQENERLESEIDTYLSEVQASNLAKKQWLKPGQKRSKVALLIAAHNEELVIESTIQSAIESGQPAKHIYVVDDNSTDATSKLARKLLPRSNVKKVERSGKGLALMRGTTHFGLTERYEWVHIADADGSFSEDYFKALKRELNPDYAAVTGYIQSQPGGVISQCRVYEYTIGMEMMRRFQSLFGVIPIIPGATSCFRSDVFEKVDFNSGSMTEDFDVTVQIHRYRLGKIQFIPEISAYTQDPKDLRDYMKQVNRWNRGFMQVLRRHNLGMMRFGIDGYIAYQVFVSFFYILNFFVWVPYLVWSTGNWNMLAIMFIADVIFMFSMVVAAAGLAKRWDILAAFPNIYAIRWLNMLLFTKAVGEVFIFRKFKVSSGVWSTGGRRYKPTTV